MDWQIGDIFYAVLTRDGKYVLHKGIVCALVPGCGYIMECNPIYLLDKRAANANLNQYALPICFKEKEDALQLLLSRMIRDTADLACFTVSNTSEDTIASELEMLELYQNLVEACDVEHLTPNDEVYSYDTTEPYG